MGKEDTKAEQRTYRGVAYHISKDGDRWRAHFPTISRNITATTLELLIELSENEIDDELASGLYKDHPSDSSRLRE